MKRVLLALLTLTALMLAAGTSFAYVQPGHLPQTTTNAVKPVIGSGQDVTPLPDIVNDPNWGSHRGRTCPPPGDRPTNPVPEPGTMMLASMGLIALGASLHRRHR